MRSVLWFSGRKPRAGEKQGWLWRSFQGGQVLQNRYPSQTVTEAFALAARTWTLRWPKLQLPIGAPRRRQRHHLFLVNFNPRTTISTIQHISTDLKRKGE